MSRSSRYNVIPIQNCIVEGFPRATIAALLLQIIVDFIISCPRYIHMEEDAGDISQLMAFADAIGFSNLDDEVWGSVIKPCEYTNTLSTSGINETAPWIIPQLVDGRRGNDFSHIIAAFNRIEPATDEPIDSPDSPTARNRTSLFTLDDKTVDIEVCGETVDPRNVCVVDHPGRHAHFKSWMQVGAVSEDTRRISVRDESGRPACWQSSNKEPSRVTSSDDSLLGCLLKPKSPQDSSLSSLAGLFSLGQGSREEPQKDSPTDTKPAKVAWKDRTFVVGKSIKVAMRDAGLHQGNVREWCLWFNDLLCSLGMSDMRAVGQPQNQTMEADIDLSDNYITDAALNEIVHLLSAFKRLHVRSLRMASSSLTDIGLGYLAGIHHLQHLVVDDNIITDTGLVSFILRNRAHKLDIHEALLAQDVSDESVLQPIWLSVELNLISDALLLVEHLAHEKITVCRADTTGCEASPGQCQLHGMKCGVHLSGLGAQKKLIG